jgi:MFS transporter, ACDE family, multidrug resistance protein
MKFKKIHLFMLCCTAFFAMSGGALLSPALPEMVEPLHTSTAEIGLLMSLYTFSTAIFTLIVGHFIDRVDRKRILVPSLIIYGLTGVVSFFLINFQSLLILRFIQGIGVGGMTAMSLVIIGDVYKGLESVHAIGLISMAFAIGTILASLIGGGLAMFGWNYPFLFYVFSIPFALFVGVFLPETRNETPISDHKGIGEAFVLLKDFRISYTIFMGFAIYFLLFSMTIYLPFMLKSMFEFTSLKSGFMLAIIGVVVILVASRIKILVCKYSIIPVIITGFSLVGLAMIGIPILPSIIGIALLLLMFGAGLGIAQPVIDALIVRISPSYARGGILSIHSFGKYVGQSIAPVILGIILVYSGFTMVFMISGFIGLFMALFTYGIKDRLSSSNRESG